jgi:hypothetical protein
MSLKLKVHGELVSPTFGHYMDEEGNPTRLALQFIDDIGAPYGTATVNPPDDPLAEGECFVKNWGGNEPLIEALLAAGWLESTGREVKTGYVAAPVMRIAGDLLTEYEKVA